MKKYLLMIMPLVLLGCGSAQTSEGTTTELVENAEPVVTETIESAPNNSNATSKNDVVDTGNLHSEAPRKSAALFTGNEKVAVDEIKSLFETGIMKGTTLNNRAEAYLAHADLIRRDQFNKVPITFTFPFNGGFDLSMIGSKVNELSFFTKKCGFQSENGKVINFHCLLNESKLMQMMAEEGKTNNFIKTMHDDYQKSKSITPNVQQALIMSGAESFDFTNENHQLIYMFYQIAINEERLALKNYNAGNGII